MVHSHGTYSPFADISVICTGRLSFSGTRHPEGGHYGLETFFLNIFEALPTVQCLAHGKPETPIYEREWRNKGKGGSDSSQELVTSKCLLFVLSALCQLCGEGHMCIYTCIDAPPCFIAI